MEPKSDRLDLAQLLPATLAGHWETDDGHKKAQDYATRPRARLALGDTSDLKLATAIYLVDRDSLHLIRLQAAAKQRIRWLSVQLALAKLALGDVLRCADDADGVLRFGLMDCRDNEGQPYQSADLERVLKQASTVFHQIAGEQAALKEPG